jgi:hypothetical protein
MRLLQQLAQLLFVPFVPPSRPHVANGGTWLSPQVAEDFGPAGSAQVPERSPSQRRPRKAGYTLGFVVQYQ